MKVGVSHVSVADLAVWSQGAWSADYPVTNLSDLINIRKVARASAAGARTSTFILPASASVGFLALVNHNLIAGDTIRWRLFSDNNPDPAGNAGAIVYDSTTVAVWPTGAPNALYPSVRPLVLPSAVTARSGHLVITTAQTVEIGAIEISNFWEWPGISPGFEIGVAPRLNPVQLVGGGEDAGEVTWNPRVANGQIDYIKLGVPVDTALDFQKRVGRQRPFVFVYDADDATTWGRKTMLATNVDLPALVGALYRHDQYQFRFREHVR